MMSRYTDEQYHMESGWLGNNPCRYFYNDRDYYRYYHIHAEVRVTYIWSSESQLTDTSDLNLHPAFRINNLIG